MRRRIKRIFTRILGGLLVVTACCPGSAMHAQDIVLSQVATIHDSEYASRRDSLVECMPDGLLLVAGAGQAGAEEYRIVFHQDNQLAYLTGCDEPDATLMVVKSRYGITTTLFTADKDPASETWTGPLLGPTNTAAQLGIPARSSRELERIIDSVLTTTPVAVYLAGDRTRTAQLKTAITAIHPSAVITQGNGIINQLRARKSVAELTMLRKAIELTNEAHRQALMRVEPGRGEHEIEALVEYVFRSQGGDSRPAFPSIIASGPNSTILHYNRNNRIMKSGDLVVIDIGASYKGYAGDVTRTLPVNGVFTPEQRAIYQAVRNAQASAERQAVLGMPARRMTDSAIAVLATELTQLGLIESPDATYACRRGRCPQYSLYFMHGVGHPLGLDVHDVGTGPNAFDVIQPGDAFTIEPGLYVRANTIDLIDDVPENEVFKEKLRPAITRYQNIGIRIEDNYLATADSVEWVSRIIREVDDIESAMLELQQQHPMPVPHPPLQTPSPKTIPSSWRTSMQIAAHSAP